MALVEYAVLCRLLLLYTVERVLLLLLLLELLLEPLPQSPPTLHRTWSTHGYSPPGTGPRGVSSVGGQSVHT